MSTKLLDVSFFVHVAMPLTIILNCDVVWYCEISPYTSALSVIYVRLF